MEPLPLLRELTVDNLSFRYPTSKNVLDGISLTIKAKSVIGIVGSTGSGKSTFLDLLLGLLEPTGGRVTVDGVPLDARSVRRWQTSLGYVPQQIFLTDGEHRGEHCPRCSER